MIVLSAKNLSKVYGTDVIIEKVSFHVNEGDRIGIIGKNGAGKSTLLNMLTGEYTCDEGEFFISQNTRIGYLKQRENFNSGRTVIQEVTEIFRDLLDMEKEMESIATRLEHLSAASVGADAQERDELIHRQANLHDTYYRRGGEAFRSEIRGILNSMAFGPEYYDKKIETLSGGERTRLALATLLLEKPDILMLDEPTNHLDIESKEVFEDALLDFPGTCIIVSHDRYFLNRVPTRIIELTRDGVDNYLGRYDYYVEKKQQLIQSGKKYMESLSGRNEAPENKLSQSDEDEENLSSAERRKLQKEREAEERRLERRKQQLEKNIGVLEDEIKQLEEQVGDPDIMTDHEKLAAISSSLQQKRDQLDAEYEEWLELQI